MANIQIFNSPEFGDIRATDRNGQKWYSSADVCRACGIANSRDAVSRLDEDKKITLSFDKPNPNAGIPHKLTFVSQAGLCFILMRSNQPVAWTFYLWITCAEPISCWELAERYLPLINVESCDKYEKVTPLLTVADVAKIFHTTPAGIYMRLCRTRQWKDDFPLPLTAKNRRCFWREQQIYQYLDKCERQITSTLSQQEPD